MRVEGNVRTATDVKNLLVMITALQVSGTEKPVFYTVDIPLRTEKDLVGNIDIAEEISKTHKEDLNERYGLNFFNDFNLRSCASESFMDGALLKWTTREYDAILAKNGKYTDYLPYSNFFYGDVDPSSGKFIVGHVCGGQGGCGYDVSSSFCLMLEQLSVYSKKFHDSVQNGYISVKDVFGPIIWTQLKE